MTSSRAGIEKRRKREKNEREMFNLQQRSHCRRFPATKIIFRFERFGSLEENGHLWHARTFHIIQGSFKKIKRKIKVQSTLLLLLNGLSVTRNPTFKNVMLRVTPLIR